MGADKQLTVETETFPHRAGRRGERVRSDCWVGLAPAASGGLHIELESTVEVYYGASLREQVAAGCALFGMEHGRVCVEDGGAYPFVFMARLEAALRLAFPESKARWLPEEVARPGAGSAESPGRDRFRRSRLYLPGNEAKYFLNAALHGPDAIILDLEDSVAPGAKNEARILVRNALRAVDFASAERMLRINQGDLGLVDLTETVEHGVELVVIPKVETAAQVERVDDHIRSLTEREVLLMPIIESARGIVNAAAIARSSTRNVALTIGLEDYTADLGVPRTEAGAESLHARNVIVNAARAAGLQAIDSVYSDVADEAGLARSVREARALGFEGKGCIHPRQVPVVHAALAPEEAEVERACAIVRAFREAQRAGLGVVSLGSKMIDPPVVKRAQQTIALALATGQLAEDWDA
ncbi:MAG: citrate lyase ACP [Planctomycetes bacterium]|nr:citrate lyase ACP [Planctomycetota bacterium]